MDIKQKYYPRCTCGQPNEKYEADITFCTHCGMKRINYKINDIDVISRELNVAGILLSFVGIMSAFILGIFFLFFKPEIEGYIKIISFSSIIICFCVLLIICSYLLRNITTLKNGKIHDLCWIEDIVKLLYIPLILTILNLGIISWQAGWIYGTICTLCIIISYFYLKHTLSYEESIFRHITILEKQGFILKNDLVLLNQWIDFIEFHKIMKEKDIKKIRERIINLPLAKSINKKTKSKK